MGRREPSRLPVPSSRSHHINAAPAPQSPATGTGETHRRSLFPPPPFFFFFFFFPPPVRRGDRRRRDEETLDGRVGSRIRRLLFHRYAGPFRSSLHSKLGIVDERSSRETPMRRRCRALVDSLTIHSRANATKIMKIIFEISQVFFYSNYAIFQIK